MCLWQHDLQTVVEVQTQRRDRFFDDASAKNQPDLDAAPPAAVLICSRADAQRTVSPLSSGAAGLAGFAAKIRRVDFDRAAHLEQTRANASAEGIFLYGDALATRQSGRGSRGIALVKIIGGQDGHAPLVVTRIQYKPNNVEYPRGWFAGAEIVQHQQFHRADRLENAHLRRLARRIVAGLNFLEQLAVIAEEPGMAPANQFL